MTSLDPIGNGPYSTTPSPRVKKAKVETAQETASRSAGSDGTLAASTLKITGDTLDTGKLRETLGKILGQFHKGEALTSAVDSAMESLKGLQEKVKGGKAVEFRIVGLDTSYGADGAFGAAASIRGYGVEVGIVRDGRVAATDAQVLGIDGRAAGLSKDAKAEGIRSGRYTLTEDLSKSRNSVSIPGADIALARLEMIRDNMDMYGPMSKSKRNWWS
ncbi:MAG TPA: hypothetical protein VEY95_06770 [Azospirillaceae bacterium]|nr:hypothetical protein [Azospirillaceae bacterium]